MDVTEEELLARARRWISQVHPHPRHLERTLHWLLLLDPQADIALQIAAVVHDAERAFPSEQKPPGDGDPLSAAYTEWHQERCARIAGWWLREQNAGPELIERVTALVRRHEDGGSSDADLVQAADSLAFLEVQSALFERLVAVGEMPRDLALRKLQWMYDRLRVARARPLAAPMLTEGLARIEAVGVDGDDAAFDEPERPSECAGSPSQERS